MFKAYPAVIHHEDGSYWVEFPDLPGCQSDGATIPEVIANANEALGLYLYSLMERDLEPASPSDINDIERPKDGFTTYVAADPYRYIRKTKAVKKTLTIPEWLNEEAEKRHINFSSVLQEALLEQIQG